MGRLLRGPEGHDGGDGGDGGSGGDAGDGGEGAASGDAGDGDGSLLGDAGKEGGSEGGQEGQGGEGEAAQGGEGEGDQGEGDGLPETYDLKPPEGYEALDPSLIDAADPIFRELGLGTEQAQKLVGLVPLIQKQVAEAQDSEFQAASTAWAKEAKADPHMGGANWKETETFVAKALDFAAAKLPPIEIEKEVDGRKAKITITGQEQVDEFRELLNATKLGNHPTMLRIFRFFGRGISEDSDFIRADGGAQVKKSREEVLYPDDVRKG